MHRCETTRFIGRAWVAILLLPTDRFFVSIFIEGSVETQWADSMSRFLHSMKAELDANLTITSA